MHEGKKNMTLDDCVKHADERAQEVVNGWAVNVKTGHNADITVEYRVLFDKALAYRAAKETEDSRRKIQALGELEAAEETATRRTFAEAYKVFHDQHEAA